MTYQTTPAGIAAALRRAADDIEAMGDVELSPVAVTLHVQAVQYRGTGEERVASVDALCRALVGVPGAQDDGNAHHNTPYEVRESRGDLAVTVFTNPAEYTRGAL